MSCRKVSKAWKASPVLDLTPPLFSNTGLSVIEENSTQFVVSKEDWVRTPLEFNTGEGGRMQLDYLKTYPPIVSGYRMDGDDLVVTGTRLRCYGDPLAVVLGTQVLYVSNISDSEVSVILDPGLLRNDIGALDYGVMWSTGQMVMASGHFFNPGTPVIDRIDPPIGSTDTVITLHGRNFLPADASDPQVVVNGASITVLSVNDTQIQARLGTAATNVVAPVQVTHSSVSGSSAQMFYWVAWGQSPAAVLTVVRLGTSVHHHHSGP